MRYTFSFYKESDLDEIRELVIKSYEWEYPVVGLSRIEFARGLNPGFAGIKNAWTNTVAVYRENDRVVACVWNEMNYGGEVFFLFDSKERAEEEELLRDMINFSKMYGTIPSDDPHTIGVSLFIPEWNKTLLRIAGEAGMVKSGWPDHYLVLPFTGEEFDATLPEGYTFADGNITPAFYLANVHRFAFGYAKDNYSIEHGVEGFEELRTMKHYDKDLDLCILDKEGRPVAMAIIWYDERIPYCELEPLGVTWWERRKGLATAILHEAANRVMRKYPDCKGMKGGDQEFYRSIGYEEKSEIWPYHWERTMHISWEPESKDEDYSNEMFKLED